MFQSRPLMAYNARTSPVVTLQTSSGNAQVADVKQWYYFYLMTWLMPWICEGIVNFVQIKYGLKTKPSIWFFQWWLGSPLLVIWQSQSYLQLEIWTKQIPPKLCKDVYLQYTLFSSFYFQNRLVWEEEEQLNRTYTTQDYNTPFWSLCSFTVKKKK